MTRSPKNHLNDRRPACKRCLGRRLLPRNDSGYKVIAQRTHREVYDRCHDIAVEVPIPNDRHRCRKQIDGGH